MIFECQKCFHFRKFFYFVQKLIVDQWKLAVKKLTNENASVDELFDELICSVDCLFWRQYQFLCKHLWHYNIVFDAFQSFNWAIWTEMFENSDFEIYEMSSSLKIEHHEKIKKIDRHMLQMKKILNVIKNKYYDIIEHTVDWTTKKRQSQMQRWIDWLNKLIESIKKQKMKKTLQKLKNKKTAVLVITKTTKTTKTKTTEKNKKKRQRNEKNENDYWSLKKYLCMNEMKWNKMKWWKKFFYESEGRNINM